MPNLQEVLEDLQRQLENWIISILNDPEGAATLESQQKYPELYQRKEVVYYY